MTTCIIGLLHIIVLSLWSLTKMVRAPETHLTGMKKTIEMGTAVQMQYIVSPAPPHVTRHSCGLPDWECNSNKHKWEALYWKLMRWFICVLDFYRWMPILFSLGRTTVFSTNWQLRLLKYYWFNWQWAESHRPQQKQASGHGMHMSKQNNWQLHCFWIKM